MGTWGCSLGGFGKSRFFLFSLTVITLWGLGGRLGAQSKPESISCESAYQIAEWSWKSTPSEKTSALTDAAFGRKVMARYLELVDPNKVLFLQSEVDSYLDQAGARWESFVTEHQCVGYEQWLAAEYPKAKARFEKIFFALPLEKHLPANLPMHGNEEKGYPTFHTYAKDEAEIKSRAAKFATAIGDAAGKTQLTGFRGDVRALMAFVMPMAVYPLSVPAPVHLLARASVGAIDPFSDYFSDDEYADFYRDLTGGTSGIGVRVREMPTGLLVLKVAPGTPAAASKQLHPGDLITHADGVALSALQGAKHRYALEGAEGTPVELTVAQADGKSPRKVQLVRKAFAFEDTRIESRMVSLRSRPGRKMAVISIPSFYGRGGESLVGERSSAEDLETELSKVLKSDPSVIVLDLRGNPGGYLEEAVAMAGLFIGGKPVVTVVDPITTRVQRDRSHAIAYHGPLVVLVDENSASASEILAGALKDYQRAVIIGTPTTYGKGSVQRLFYLKSGLIALDPQDQVGVLKLTTSFFYSPLGKSPADGGVRAHIVLQKPKSTEPHRKQAVPKQSPFVDGSTLSDIQLRERTMQMRVAALKESNAERTEDVKGIFKDAVKKAFGREKADESAQTSLAESLAIADDLVTLEQGSLGAKTRQAIKPNGSARR